MAQTADQLAARQKQQADRVRDLIAQQNAPRAPGQSQPRGPSEQEIDKMVNDRQQVSDDLSHLTQRLRDAARELAPTQPAATGKLRGALEGMDQNDLGTRVQQSSDFLRRGQFSDPLETGLTSDLKKLSQEVDDAARALGSAERPSEDAKLNRAMDDLARLRDQINSMGGQGRPGQQPAQQPGQQGRGGQNGQRQTDALARNGQQGQGQQGQGQQGQGQQGQGQQGQGQQGQGGQQQAQNGQGGQNAGGRQGGQAGDRLAGIIRNQAGGGTNNSGERGPMNDGVDPGIKRTGGGTAEPRQGPNPADTQKQIEQGLNLLAQVRSAVQDSPEAKQQLQALIDQMRNLDPKRFALDPKQVDQMHQQLVSEVDALELQLRRQLDENQGGTIRNADPTKVPAGYQASVAEYYRKLSGAAH
jgi:hypothetical protein